MNKGRYKYYGQIILHLVESTDIYATSHRTFSRTQKELFLVLFKHNSVINVGRGEKRVLS